MPGKVLCNRVLEVPGLEYFRVSRDFRFVRMVVLNILLGVKIETGEDVHRWFKASTSTAWLEKLSRVENGGDVVQTVDTFGGRVTHLG